MKALAKSVAVVGQVVSVAIGSNFTTGETKPEGICFVLVQDGLITSAFRKLSELAKKEAGQNDLNSKTRAIGYSANQERGKT